MSGFAGDLWDAKMEGLWLVQRRCRLVGAWEMSGIAW